MKINKHSKATNDYIDFVVMGLKSYERANKVIDTIDVFNGSITVTYKNEGSLTELLNIHSHIEDYGLDSFFSIADMKSGNTVTYKLEN
jgi:hypothetical protein